MGGDAMTPLSLTPEQESLADQDFPIRDDFSMQFENGTVDDDEHARMGHRSSSSSLELEAEQRRRSNVYREVLQSYDQLQVRSESLNEAKRKILSYVPGGWIENVGGVELNDYDVPKTTTLILIGPKGCGKSSLINRISRVLEDDKFASERAQVSYNPSVGDGTYFLQEYMIPRGSTSFCLYDTRSLSDDTSENINMITSWMTKGVRHGELVIRKSDSSSLRRKIKCKTREQSYQASERRMVNFVIFVVDGVAVLKSMEEGSSAEKQYMQMISSIFNCPYLSFKDDKPALVITHGDLLSLADRIRVHVHLGDLLGIPPAKQVFDIPESCDPVTELTIVDMLRYSLEHADRNLPHKNWAKKKVPGISLSMFVYMFIILAIAFLSVNLQHLNEHRARKSTPHIDWHAIRHMWLE